jgi:glycine cleavage system H protein
MRYYTREHEWIEVTGDQATIGITDFAQHALGDVVYAELPALGKALKAGQEAAVVESVKAASDVYAPVSGSVIAANDALTANPALINQSPEADGWFFRMQLSAPEELTKLLDDDAYKAHIKALG